VSVSGAIVVVVVVAFRGVASLGFRPAAGAVDVIISRPYPAVVRPYKTWTHLSRAK
jgi:hypothetical protein